jgi:acetyl-CoA decarbonylase/synthase complex subunit gamma
MMEQPSFENKKDESCCCGPAPVDGVSTGPDFNAHWVDGAVKTAVGKIPRVTTVLKLKDNFNTWIVRWGIGRMRYAISPGLYAVGSPRPESPVLVSANYKMSFDCLRSSMHGRDAWILVLDTKAVNVWCSAGKGTFGTAELVSRLQSTRLKEVISHNKLILPQLSATGVSAHQVKSMSGFKVIFGPVRAQDIPEFINAGLKATPDMRRVKFPIGDRIVLAPVEIVGFARYAIPAAIVLFILSGLGPDGYDMSRVFSYGVMSVFLVGIAWIHGAVFTPFLLPWLPGRSFSAKGAWAGLLILIWPTFRYLQEPDIVAGWVTAIAWLFIIPAVSSFLGMNFTGASTYTSLSGVKKEMRIAVPMQISFIAIGLVLWVTGLFVRG